MRKGFFYFLDLPVYRLPEDRYYKERDDYVDRVMIRSKPSLNTSTAERMSQQDEAMRSRLFDSYGGAWRYNEIIGYVRLHLLGTQIRGEYWRVNKKRVVRTRNKVLEFWGWKLAPETDLPHFGTNAEIYQVILEHVDDCKRELKAHYLDSDQLTSLGPYIDWRALLEWA